MIMIETTQGALTRLQEIRESRIASRAYNLGVDIAGDEEMLDNPSCVLRHAILSIDHAARTVYAEEHAQGIVLTPREYSWDRCVVHRIIRDTK